MWNSAKFESAFCRLKRRLFFRTLAHQSDSLLMYNISSRFSLASFESGCGNVNIVNYESSWEQNRFFKNFFGRWP